MVIGIGAIAPGVSGGAIAVILGIYEDLTRAIGIYLRILLKRLNTLCL